MCLYSHFVPSIANKLLFFSRAVLLFRRRCKYTLKIEKRSSPVKEVQGKHPPPLCSLEMDMKSNTVYVNTGPQTRVTGDETGSDYEVIDEGDRVIYEVIDEEEVYNEKFK